MRSPVLTLCLVLVSASPLPAADRAAETAFDEGVQFLEAGRFDEASAAFDRCLVELPANDPERALVLFQLGLAHANAGRSAEAAEAFRRSIRIDPDVPASRLFLGHTLRLQGEPLEAAGEDLAALRLDPGSARAHDGLWQAYAEISERYGHDRELALRELFHIVRLVEIEPGYPKVFPAVRDELRYVQHVLKRLEAAGATPEQALRAYRQTAAFTGEPLETDGAPPGPLALPEDGILPSDKLAALAKSQTL